MTKKPITITLLKPTVEDGFSFMRSFIANIEAKPFVYQNLHGYINRESKVGVLGRYDDKLVLPMDANSELTAMAFLTESARDEKFKGFVWVLENRGCFGSTFLQFIYRVANVNRKPKQFDPKAN